MALDQTRANEILTYMHGAGAPPTLTSATTEKVRLMTANGSATANGTELATSGGYTAVTGITITSWAAASAGSQATSAAVTQSNMPATTIVGIEIWDASGTPKRVEWGSHTSKVLSSGDTLTYASGAITSSLA